MRLNRFPEPAEVQAQTGGIAMVRIPLIGVVALRNLDNARSVALIFPDSPKLGLSCNQRSAICIDDNNITHIAAYRDKGIPHSIVLHFAEFLPAYGPFGSQSSGRETPLSQLRNLPRQGTPSSVTSPGYSLPLMRQVGNVNRLVTASNTMLAIGRLLSNLTGRYLRLTKGARQCLAPFVRTKES